MLNKENYFFCGPVDRTLYCVTATELLMKKAMVRLLLEVFKIHPNEKPNSYGFGKGIWPPLIRQREKYRVGQKTWAFDNGAGEVSEDSSIDFGKNGILCVDEDHVRKLMI